MGRDVEYVGCRGFESESARNGHSLSATAPVAAVDLPFAYGFNHELPANTTFTVTFMPYLNLTVGTGQYFDAWVNPYPWQQVNPTNGAIYAFSGATEPTLDGSTRVSDDVILTNVISFDVKAWDPLAPIISMTTAGDCMAPLPANSPVYMPGDLGYTSLCPVGMRSREIVATNVSRDVQRHQGRGAYVV